MDATQNFSPISRGLALFFSAFSLLNLIGLLRSHNFDATIWWVDIRLLPLSVARSFVLILALVLLAYACRPKMRLWRQIITLILVGIALLFTAGNTIAYFTLLVQHRIHTLLPIPLSLFITLALLLVVLQIVANAASPTRRAHIITAIVAASCLLAFPLAQMVCFGSTDYSRQADAIVVFGARTYANGEASQALGDRVLEAVDLYKHGLAHTLIFSGGLGDGATHETQAMRRLAIENGVPSEDILLDPNGLNTAATVANTTKMFEEHHFTRIIAVSHFYHLPRIKMSYQRAGIEVFTVPVRRPLVQTPMYMARETAALWLYYLRAA